jgi:membrane protein YqaA with SNARE-associated domain
VEAAKAAAMLNGLYRRVMALAGSRNAAWWLALIAFAESSFFPIPPDALLVPMALARPSHAWRLAAICTVASVAGGALGYLIGFAVFDHVARPILDLYGYGAAYAAFQAKFQEYGLWIILIKGLTPIPYKIVTIAAGAARFDFALFMGASILTRGARFFLVATLLHFFGDTVREFIERRLTLVTTALAVGVVGGFLALKFL